MHRRMGMMPSAACSQRRHRRMGDLASLRNERVELRERNGTEWRRRRRLVHGYPTTLLLALVFVVLLVTPAAAVQIPFQNCLPDSYRFNDPTLLQWDPLHVEAVFETDTDRHNLKFIVWGNVTGSENNVELPPPNDPYWDDNSETEGKIVEQPRPDARPLKATTLYRRVEVLTYETWEDVLNFCTQALVGASCPLGPTFDAGAIDGPYGLPSVNLTHDFFSSYSFTSLTATFIVIWGDPGKTNIGCVSATITPDLGERAWLLTFLPLLILLLVGGAVVFAAIFSPWGTTNPLHWTSNYGRDADLLRLVTPGFADCLQYIQFIVLAGSLSLNYPGFFQPIVSQASWAALMFNQSFVTGSPSWEGVVDGMYVTDSKYGLGRLAQLVGLRESQDIWAGMMVWFCVIIAAVLVLTQIGFTVQWVYRKISNTTDEDLRNKNLPFSVGNVVRVTFNYLLLPIVSLSAFQLVIASDSPSFTVALAAIFLVALILFAAWVLFFIVKTQPKSVLFDDLPTVLRYGPLYNTYSDEAAAFALIPVLLTFVRGIAIGAVQPSGITQIVLLAICEVIQILTLHAFRPFHSPTSMNAYHTTFAVLRLITVMLMVAFVPSLGVTDGPRGWIGYVILLIHAIVLVLGFFLNALQTIVEVIALMLGAGGDDNRGLTRGGLSKIFGMRQLSRRVIPRDMGPSRASQLSSAAMLDGDETGKTGYSMPSGRLRSESGASLGGIMAHNRHRSSSALDSFDMYSNARPGDNASSYMPGTPGGETSIFSFINSPTLGRNPQQVLPPEAADPYYRPPRRRRETIGDESQPSLQNLSISADPNQMSGILVAPPEPGEAGEEISRGATPAPPATANPVATALPNRPDYSTREVDFYYGVRGPALNSDGPGRKLGTGPADPTGPVATATGWFRNMFGGKTKEKGKGFEVVRSSRMPPAMMARNGGFGDETPPEGIPVAMGVLRNGPIDSDDDEPNARTPRKKAGDLLTDSGDPRGADPDEPGSPVMERLPGASQPPDVVEPEGGSSRAKPDVPRKSSKRNSALYSRSPSREPPGTQSSQADGDSTRDGKSPMLARLPFERNDSQKRLSTYSSMEFPQELVDMGVRSKTEERPASFGMVSQHSISRIDPHHVDADLLGTSAELIDEESPGRQPSNGSHNVKS